MQPTTRNIVIAWYVLHLIIAYVRMFLYNRSNFISRSYTDYLVGEYCQKTVGITVGLGFVGICIGTYFHIGGM